jgi:hypothetical protein
MKLNEVWQVRSCLAWLLPRLVALTTQYARGEGTEIIQCRRPVWAGNRGALECADSATLPAALALHISSNGQCLFVWFILCCSAHSELERM